MSNFLRRLVSSSSSTAVFERSLRNGSSSQLTRILRARNLHTDKRHTQVPYPIEEGLGDFLSPEALKVIANDWQYGLLSRLDDEVKGTEFENSNIADIIIGTASDRSKTLAFNYASQALNNTFFLNYLRPPHPTETDYENYMGKLKNAIREDYKDITYLKEEVMATAMGMFSSGWVWVAVSDLRRIVVIPTFGPGTLLVRSRQQRYSEDILMALPSKYNPSPDYELDLPPPGDLDDLIPPISPRSPYEGGYSAPPKTTSPVSGVSSSPNNLIPPSGSSQVRYNSSLSNNPHHIERRTELWETAPRNQWMNPGEIFTPLFCVSVHEHMWMAGGYGVWGKEEYLKRFWKVLDWNKVGETYEKATGFTFRMTL